MNLTTETIRDPCGGLHLFAFRAKRPARPIWSRSYTNPQDMTADLETIALGKLPQHGSQYPKANYNSIKDTQ